MKAQLSRRRFFTAAGVAGTVAGTFWRRDSCSLALGVSARGAAELPDRRDGANMPSGRCLCGTFEYTVDGSFGDVRYCHCSRCRRGSGTAFSANARIQRSQWSLQGPRDQIIEYEHKARRVLSEQHVTMLDLFDTG